MASFNISSPDQHTLEVNGAFSTCLVANHRPLNESNGLETHPKKSAAASYRTSEEGLVRAVTLVFLLSMVAHFLL